MMNPQEIITVADNLVTLFISSSTPEDEIQNIIKTSDISNIPESFIRFTNNKDIIDITLRSTAPTGKIEILESPINTLLAEKYAITCPQLKELGEHNSLSEKLEEKNTTSPLIEESTTSTLGWLFNLPYAGIKKIFNPIKDFILSFFCTTSISEDLESSTQPQVINAEPPISKEVISQDELNKILEDALPNATVTNNHEHLSTIIKGKEAYKESKISKWDLLVHIDVIIKLYNLFIEQQENALSKFSERSIAVHPHNRLIPEYLRIREQLDEITSTELANKKEGVEAFKKTKSSNIEEFYVPSSDFILSRESNLNLVEQQLPAKEDKGQSSGSNCIKNDESNGVFIELPYDHRSRNSLYKTYNNAFSEEAKNLKLKNDIIKGINDGEINLTDDNKLNELLNCAGRQLSQDPKIQEQSEFKFNVEVLRQYFKYRTTEYLMNNKPISIGEIVELMCQIEKADIFFPKKFPKELKIFDIYQIVQEKFARRLTEIQIRLNQIK
jgi:hypothetical protein